MDRSELIHNLRNAIANGDGGLDGERLNRAALAEIEKAQKAEDKETMHRLINHIIQLDAKIDVLTAKVAKLT